MRADWCGWRLIRSFALLLQVTVLIAPMSAPLRAQDAKDAQALNAQVVQLYRTGKYADAIPLAQRALAINEKAFGTDDPNVATSLNNLAALYRAQGSYAEAEPLYKRALSIREKALGSDHPDVASVLDNLALLYHYQGRYAEAETLYGRALSIREKALGSDHPDVASVLDNLAALYQAQGRYAEAEPLFKRALGIDEKALGLDDQSVAIDLNNLAELYQTQGRYTDAEPYFVRALSIAEKTLGPDHPFVAKFLDNLAGLYQDEGRYADAEPLYKRVVEVFQKELAPNDPDNGTALNNLADLYRAQGRYADAAPLYRHSLDILKETFGPDHPSVATVLINLAEPDRAQGRYKEAEPNYRSALAIREKSLGPDHPDVSAALSDLAILYYEQKDWQRAVDLWRRSTSVITRRAKRGTDSVGQPLTGKTKNEAEQHGGEFWGLVKAAFRVVAAERAAEPGLAAEMFQIAQWAQSSAAAVSLVQMAARGASGNLALAAVVRERQDLVAEWQKRDAAETAAVSQPPDRRNKNAEADNRTQLAAIDARIAEIDKRLANDFPDYAAFVSPTPSSVKDVQAELRPDEALVLFLDTPEWRPTPEETFAWVVTKTEIRWVRSDLGTSSLKHEVAALRCGLDSAAWKVKDQTTCAALLKLPADQASPPANKSPPFDAARAHALYKALFGEVEDLIAGKQLLIIPSGPLMQLPFQVLVTKLPSGTDYKSVAWLAREHALTVLPAVFSLAALRRVPRPSTAPLPMIGFGDPLLDGNQKHPIFGDYYKKQAALARTNQSCPKQTLVERVAALFGRDPIEPLAARGGLADVNLIRFQAPLPETANELCDVAADLKADRNEMRLGAHATEHEVKALSASGTLAKYRIVHFATHGALAGQLRGGSEPGLILTPPNTATEDDDGYLSASEIAGLKLDADWVILSACNTAAGEAGGDALSGLARAFFYAGARALLVSHWSVNSDASVKLITSAVGEITRDKTVGRAEALRRAMLAMIDTGKPEQAHPSYWAPFVVVGEGAAAR
jgi:CHAT domain-containing protein/tetratricopeptide (TPR) repeat protein